MAPDWMLVHDIIIKSWLENETCRFFCCLQKLIFCTYFYFAENSLENIALTALLQILQSVDMSDSSQANTAISVVDTIVSGPSKSSVPSGNIFQARIF